MNTPLNPKFEAEHLKNLNNIDNYSKMTLINYSQISLVRGGPFKYYVVGVVTSMHHFARQKYERGSIHVE